MSGYDGRQFVGIDLHRRRSVIVRQTASGDRLASIRIVNDPVELALQMAKAGPDAEVVLEATYGWYWAVDVLADAGAHVHLAHPLGVKGFAYRREMAYRIEAMTRRLVHITVLDAPEVRSATSVEGASEDTDGGSVAVS